MNCPWCERRLREEWEGTASAYPPPNLSQHWEDSPACRQRAELAARCRTLLPATEPSVPPAHFTDQVLGRLRQERRQIQHLSWVTTLAALVVAGATLTWLVLTAEPSRTSPLVQQYLHSSATIPVRNVPVPLDQLRHVLEPFVEARARTITLTRRFADQAGERVRRLLPRWEEFDIQPLEDAWTVSALPVRFVSEAASASLDPLATSTREAYQTFKQYLPPLARKRMNAPSR